jgi:hypothetical protein
LGDESRPKVGVLLAFQLEVLLRPERLIGCPFPSFFEEHPVKVKTVGQLADDLSSDLDL